MKTTVEVNDALHRTLTVEIPWNMLQEELEREYQELAKKAALPGFRKGKVPHGVLKQRYGRQVNDEVLARLIQDSYEAALVQNKVYPVAKPELTRGELKEGEPYTYVARVEVRPEIELKQLSGFTFAEKKVELQAEAVEHELEHLRDGRAILKPVEGREEAQKGDTAILDYRATRDGKPVRGGERQDHPLQLGGGNAVPGFEEAVLGMKVGQHKEFELVFPAEGVAPDLAGQTVRFHVELKALKQREVPALDDEFVRDLGEEGVSTVAELEAKIRRTLTERAEAQLRRERRDELIDKLIEANPFPVPPALVERQQDAMAREMQTFLSMQGLDPKELSQGFERLKKDMAGRAEREVKAALLLAAVAAREKIEVSDEDLGKHIQERAARSGQNAAQVRAYLDEPEHREEARLGLRREKVLDHLMKLSNMEPAAAAAGAPATPAADEAPEARGDKA
ncbi:MAG TPA: trigger factor [Myxococcota bacterium]|nr:trigger factor [Myxococcota bacterium]HRY92206.1 trigger factor [Myxococcota bacterium]